MAEPLDFQFELIDKMSSNALGIAAAMDKMATQMQRAEDRADSLAKKNEKSRGVMARFRHSFHEWSTGVEAALKIGERFGGAIVEIGKEILDASAKEERFVKSLEALTGSHEIAENLAKALDKMRPSFTGSEEQLKKLTQQFLTLGFSIEDVGKLLPAVGDVSARLGDPAKGQEFADLLSKIAARGATTKKDLVALGQLGFGGVLRAGERAGPAIDKLLDSLEKMQGGAIGSGSIKGAETLEQVLGRLGEMREKVFEKFKDTKAFEFLKKILTDVANRLPALIEEIPKFADEAFNAITKLVTTIKELWDLLKNGIIVIGEAVIAQKLWNEAMKLTGTDGMKLLYMNMGEMFAAMKAGASGVLPALQAGVTGLWTTLKANPIGVIVAGFQSWLTVIEEIKKNWILMKDLKFSDFNPFGKKTAADFAEPLRVPLKSAGEKMAQNVEEGVRGPQGFDMHSPSKVFEEIGRMAAAGFQKGAAGVSDLVGASPGTAASLRAVSISIPISVSGGSTNSETAGVIKNTIEEILPGMLASVFDHMALEQGAA